MLRLTYRALFLLLLGLTLIVTTIFGKPARGSNLPGADVTCEDGYALWADADVNNDDDGDDDDDGDGGGDGDDDQIRGLRWIGVANTVAGKAHSNDDILFYGSYNRVNGSLAFVDRFYNFGLLNSFPYPDEVGRDSAPVSYDLDDYRPGGRMAAAAEAAGRYHFINGRLEMRSSGAVLDGLYYVTDKVEIAANYLSGNVTIVSEERIEVWGRAHELEAYSGGLLFYAADRGSQSVELNGDDSRYNGVIFSEGDIDLDGSDTTYSGAVVGDRVDIVGDSLTVNFEATYCPTGPAPTGTPPPMPSPPVTPSATATTGSPPPALFDYYLAFTSLGLGQGPGEPNDRCDQAFGLVTGVPYFFLPEDAQDWYHFFLSEPTDLRVLLTGFVPQDGQAALYYGPACGSLTFVRNNGDIGPDKSMNLGQQPAGHYFLFVSNDGQMNSDIPYRLLIEATP